MKVTKAENVNASTTEKHLDDRSKREKRPLTLADVETEYESDSERTRPQKH